VRALRAAAIAIPLALALGPLVLVIASCNSSTNLVDKGGECFLASDCAPGLVCVEVNRQRVCTDDITGVAGRSPPEGGMPREGGEGGDADPDAPVQETGPTDTGVSDTGKPVDTGTPPVDAGNG